MEMYYEINYLHKNPDVKYSDFLNVCVQVHLKKQNIMEKWNNMELELESMIRMSWKIYFFS